MADAGPRLRGERMLAGLLLVLLLAGCAVPNVTPFADATAAYRDAITTAGATVADALRKSSEPEKTLEATTVWAERVKAADALVYYAGSLSSIVGAHQSAQDNVQRLGDTVGELAAYVPATGAIAKEGVAIAAVIGRTILEVKAAHDLDRAVEKAHPVLAKIADILKKDLIDLQVLCRNAYLDMDQSLINQWRPGKNHYEKLVEAVQKARLEADTAGFDGTTIGRLKELEALLAAQEIHFREHRDARAAVAAQRAAAEAMLDQAIAGTDDWINAHAEIGAAIRANRSPNIVLLMSRAQEIQRAVDRIRNR